MKKKYNKNKVILLIFSVVFFVLYNCLNFSVPGIFNSPDETANFVFTQTVQEENQLAYPIDQDLGYLSEFIHPRSTFVEESGGVEILPVGFWGMPVMYGVVSKLVGINLIVFLTSILVILGGWAFFGIVKIIFSNKGGSALGGEEQVALWSSVLLFFQPVLWYYTARSMFHNIPFVSLILIGLYIILVNSGNSRAINRFIARRFPRLTGSPRIFYDMLGMSIFMFGVLMRPNEIVWIALCALVVVIAYKKEISFGRLLTWVIVSLLFIGLYGYVNTLVYGSSAGSYISSRSLEIDHWYSFLFPFGINLKMVLKSGWFYFVKLFWWFSIPALFGFIVFLYDGIKEKLSKEQAVFGFIFVLANIFLFLYYGSNEDTLFSLKTVGVAYARYWLPLFILNVIFVAYGYFWVYKRCEKKRLLHVVGIVLLLISFVFSLKAVYGGVDGLKNTKINLNHAQDVRNWVLANTQESDIIITDHEDKFFWPKRQVIVRFFDFRVGEATQKLVEQEKNVYYFVPKMSEDQKVKVDEYLSQFGLGIDHIHDFDDHELYIVRLQS